MVAKPVQEVSKPRGKRRLPKTDVESRERARFIRLGIEDFGLIGRAEIEFSPGFTVFSGETGSGKTMVLGAVALVLGERIVGAVVRRGAERARLTLEYLPDERLRERCQALGFPLDPGEDGVIVREIAVQGRSSLRVNGRPATAAQLRELMAGVVELVGQHEQQRLLAPSEHLSMLDRFGGPEVLVLRDEVSLWHERRNALEEERAAILAERERELFEREAAESLLADIAAVEPEDGEDLQLRARRDALQDAERILGAVQLAHEALGGEDAGATLRVGEAVAALRSIDRYGAEYVAYLESATALQSAAQELVTDLARSAAALADADPAAIEALLERLERIERLKRRYGGSIEGIRAREQQAKAVLELGATREDRLTQTGKKLQEANIQLERTASALSAIRREVAQNLERAIEAELHALAMPSARFLVQFEHFDSIAAFGRERVNFLLAANRGGQPSPIAQCASGGELSRILLACILVLASDVDIAAVVFDEIDAGIGGATGLVLGERLAQLSQSSQVLCVTHLAQIASFALQHMVVQKYEAESGTHVAISTLQSREERIAEIARMLSGDKSSVAKEHAAILLEKASR